MMSDENIWEGERTTLTSLASKGKLVRERYRLTAEHLHFDAGILSTKAEQIPTWAIRDVDLEQSLKQRAMGIGDVIVACKHGEYTGREKVTLEGVKDPKTVRDLVMQVGKKARLEHQQRSQMSSAQGKGYRGYRLNSQPKPPRRFHTERSLRRRRGLSASGNRRGTHNQDLDRSS